MRFVIDQRAAGVLFRCDSCNQLLAQQTIVGRVLRFIVLSMLTLPFLALLATAGPGLARALGDAEGEVFAVLAGLCFIAASIAVWGAVTLARAFRRVFGGPFIATRDELTSF